MERNERSLIHPKHFLSGLALAGFFLLVLAYGALHQPDLAPATANDMLMAARLYAAKQSDGGEYETTWCDDGQVSLLSGNRYQVTGCIEGSWQGRRYPRRFRAVVERRPAALVTAIPILEFRFED